MTNERDSGRYDATTDSWIDDNVRVDFAWGNIPMQPNDDRGMAQLDPSLDSHVIATNGYKGFPAAISGDIYDDIIPNATMPNIVGMTQIQAEAALEGAGFLSWNNNTTTSGATAQNDGKVASQYPGIGTVLNATDEPQATYYDYVEVTTFPIAAVTNNGLPGGSAATDAYMYLLGRINKPTVGWYINIDGNGITAVNNNNYEVISVVDDDAFNTGGTKVLIRSTTGNIDAAGGWQGNNGTWNQL